MKNFFLASKAHILYMYMYGPSVARLRNIFRYPTQTIIFWDGNQFFLGGMFVDQTIFLQQSVGQTIFSNFMQNKLFFLKKP